LSDERKRESRGRRRFLLAPPAGPDVLPIASTEEYAEFACILAGILGRG
jgi:hypothetical protein